jgi:hypothetical protein
MGDRPLVVDVRRGEVVHDALSAQVERALGAGESAPAASVAPPTDPRVDVRPAAPGRGPGAGPWVLIGAGVASLGVGGAFLALRGGAVDNLEANCANLICTEMTAPTGNAYRDDATLYTALAGVAGGVGVLAIAGGVYWYASAPRRAAAGAVRVTPWSTGTASGLTLGARF